MGSDSTVHPVTLERVRQVFGDFATNPLPKQLESTFDRQMGAAVLRHHPNPVPLAEIEGIKELMDHLWAPELTEVAEILPESATDLSIGAVEKLSSERPSSDDLVAFNDSIPNSAAGEDSESGRTKLSVSSIAIPSLKVVDERTIQVSTSPGAVRFFRSDDGTYRYSRFMLGGSGSGESSALLIANQLFHSCRSPAVIDLLKQLGWTDVLDRYREIKSQADSSQSVPERCSPAMSATGPKNVELIKESVVDEDEEEEEQEYYDEEEACRRDSMDKTLDALVARAALIDKRHAKDEIIVERLDTDQVDGPLLDWCGLRRLWFDSDLSCEDSFLRSVIDWCTAAYVDREEWDSGAPGMSGHMITVTTFNPGELQRQIAERVRELLQETEYRRRS